MIRWTKELIDATVAAFNGGETEASIARRLKTTVGAVSMTLGRARKSGIEVVRRSGTRKKERTQP